MLGIDATADGVDPVAGRGFYYAVMAHPFTRRGRRDSTAPGYYSAPCSSSTGWQCDLVNGCFAGFSFSSAAACSCSIAEVKSKCQSRRYRSRASLSAVAIRHPPSSRRRFLRGGCKKIARLHCRPSVDLRLGRTCCCSSSPPTAGLPEVPRTSSD